MTAHGEQAVPQFVIPETIADRYRVEREIGRGGMATVYLCTDTRDGTRVAIKVLRPELASAVNVERFLREIGFASELDHPQIPKVLDSGLVGELPFYAMTFIEGESLRARLDREKQLPVEEAIRITKEIISPTAYAHRLGIIHRDIKPANILLASDRVYVLDFGVARAIVVSAGETLTSTGIAVGTPAYMSPEQALADQHLDTRSDIYSLGCVTYEMIAGIPPFVGATPQAVMSRRFVAPPPPLRETRESVPQFVEDAVAKALCKAPADRWQSVQKFSDALSGTEYSPSLFAARSAFSRRRRKYIAIAAGVTTLFVAVSAAAAWSLSNRDHVARGRAQLEEWNLEAAGKEFERALAENPGSASARLWMGQYLILNRAPSSEWAPLVLKAADSKQSLDSAERERALALAQFADDTQSSGCDALRTVAAKSDPRHADDFTAAVTLADCIAADRTVIADAASVSGFRFRASFNEAAALYDGILRRSGTRRDAFEVIVPRMQNILYTSQTALRRGVMRGEAERMFIAMPELIADTIALIPYSLSGSGAPLTSDPVSLTRLIERNLVRLRDVGIAWTEAAPDDPNAQEMLAGVLEATAKLDGPGESAIGRISRARKTLKGEDDGGAGFLQKVRLAASNTRILVKLGKFREARLLADSVLSWKPVEILPDSMRLQDDALRSGLAGLVGRMGLLIDLEQRYADEYDVHLKSGERKRLPGTVGGDVLRLRAYAVFGAPRDTIMKAYQRISENLEALVPLDQLDDYRRAVLLRPITLVADIVGTRPIASLGTSSDPFVLAVIALDKGDRRNAKRLTDSITTMRNAIAPGSLTIDAVLQEAWLRSALGDSTAAARTLDRALRGLARGPSHMIREPTLSAGLVRAMLFRAKLAHAAGDLEAYAKWSASARELWMNADPILKPTEPRIKIR